MPVAVKPDKFRRRATAMIDVSDGLLIDLWRICRESGTGARIYEERIPLSSELKKAAVYLGRSPFEFAQAGGEDYELLFTSPEAGIKDASCIGEVVKSGMKIVDADGNARDFSARGYDHFDQG